MQTSSTRDVMRQYPRGQSHRNIRPQRSRGGLSAAGGAHMARHGGLLGAPVDDEVVAQGLARDGFVDGAGEKSVVGARPQRRPQVGGGVLAEAHIERAGAGQAYSVAALAEIM